MWNCPLYSVSSLHPETSKTVRNADVYCTALSLQTSRLGGNNEFLFNAVLGNGKVTENTLT
jgi:hypothetical protein